MLLVGITASAQYTQERGISTQFTRQSQSVAFAQPEQTKTANGQIARAEVYRKPQAMTDPNMSRLRELLAKAEKGEVEALSLRDGYTRLIFEVGDLVAVRFEVTPAQFAQLKTEYADRFKGE